MSTLHEQLLAATTPRIAGTVLTSATVNAPLAALRVVVERHKPRLCSWKGCTSPATHRVCAACGAAETYPCTDITAIARELGVDGGS